MKSIIKSREQSMESPGKGLGLGRGGASVGSRRTHRSASASSRSSTSSDILVAPGPPTASRQPSLYESPLPLSPSTMTAKASLGVEIRPGGIVVVKAKTDAARAYLKSLKEDDERKAENEHRSFDETTDTKDEGNEDEGDGPNRRGTYSKQYTLQHPEIEWVHRGQGRYLPASQYSRKANSNRSDSQSKGPSANLQKAIELLEGKTRSPIIPQRRRSLDDDSKTSIFATPKQRISLRRQVSEAQTISPDQRTARLSRRAKALPSTEFERRSSRFTTHLDYNEDDDDDDMGDDKEPTFDKEYVDQHPEEKFYHTGNGWYKRGDRPKGRKMAKLRDSEGHALVRHRDGSWEFDSSRTIHVSQLGNYPGSEFHHCGNGWYKPGPDVTGHRTSFIAGEEPEEWGDDHGDDDHVDDEEDDDDDAAVSKDYALSHPDVDWVHRGNGRYKRKRAVSAPTTQASESTSPAAERDQTIYSKEYVRAHPDEKFHHRGNARYMRGSPPEHWASVRRKKNAAATAAANAAVQEDESQLFSKAYVKQHPNEVFHHRGQGRYARGPRPKTASLLDEDEDESEEDPDGLVDTDYVNAHPEETFHHRGQGRWARGLPPPGSSNKVAIRGPGSKDRPDAANLLEGEDETNKPPALTALVLRAEGPEKWPGITWHYRGGGKWGRITKQEFEDIQRGGPRRQKAKGRLRNVDGPQAQLEREAAAADAARRRGFDDGYQLAGDGDTNGLTGQEKPKIKRRRMNKRGSFLAQDEGLLSKQSSKSQSQAPTPKPRMLEPEEDILTEEDLPGLYQDDWTPDPDNLEIYGPYMPHNAFRPLNSPEKFVKALTKHEPAVRSAEILHRLTENTQRALDAMQREYLELEKITAPHARIPRKPAKGGRIPIEQQIFEDKKEADLYDFSFDQRRIGYQDPLAQKIQRDADGRELRNRRQRGAQTNNGTLPGWNFGEDEPLGPKRAVKPVNRFDGIVDQPRRRGRNSANATGRTSKAPSMTPDRVTTPLGGPAPNGYAPATSGRWRGHVPKRIRELRGESAGVGSGQRDVSPGGARKGRPPGSKNLHKRRDAGIKKGPRKPKVVDSIETPLGSEGEGEV